MCSKIQFVKVFHRGGIQRLLDAEESPGVIDSCGILPPLSSARMRKVPSIVHSELRKLLIPCLVPDEAEMRKDSWVFFFVFVGILPELCMIQSIKTDTGLTGRFSPSGFIPPRSLLLPLDLVYPH